MPIVNDLLMPSPSSPISTKNSTPRDGFSLVELAIVLAVVGLLVGGILVGQDMIRNTRLKGFIKQQELIHAAVQQFYERYNSLPGDMPNATNIWGAQDATAATCIVTASTSALTCNGNGSGKIAPLTETASYERFRLWQHLANAELIQGKYNGTSNSYNIDGYAPHVFDLTYVIDSSGSANVFDGIYRHTLTSGVSNPLLTSAELAGIDVKYDDGMPATGDYVGTITAGFGCTVKADGSANPASTDLDAIYNIANSNTACQFYRRNFTGR